MPSIFAAFGFNDLIVLYGHSLYLPLIGMHFAAERVQKSPFLAYEKMLYPQYFSKYDVRVECLQNTVCCKYSSSITEDGDTKRRLISQLLF